MSDYVKVTCELASPIVGDPPMLDAILYFEMLQRLGYAVKLRRGDPLPKNDPVHIPILLKRLGDEPHIPCCSSPILDSDDVTTHHFTRAFSAEHSSLVQPNGRRIVPTNMGYLKSYRLPLKVHVAKRIAWFAVGKPRPIRQLLRSVKSIGHKRSMGYGRVLLWTVERIDSDLSWHVPTDDGPVLMRPLPLCGALGDKLPLGGRRDFGSCRPPYWHPERFREIVVPC